MTINELLPDSKEFKKYYLIAQTISVHTYNKIGEIVQKEFNGVHITEYEYQVSIGFLYSKE